MTTETKLKIIWDDLPSIDVVLNNIPPSDFVIKSMRFLQNVDLPTQAWDNPFGAIYRDNEFVVDRLYEYASKLNLDIDKPKIIDQEYLNFVHKIYEQNYDGDPDYLQFHETIHRLEELINGLVPPNRIGFEYREKSGLLEKDFDRSYLKYATLNIKKGTLYMSWQELGKTPYRYFMDNEPSDITRLCELAKPWNILKPNFFVSIIDKDYLQGKDLNKFNEWFQKYKQDWCDFWNLSDWTPEEMFKVIPVGYIPDVDNLIERYKNNILPKRLILCQE